MIGKPEIELLDELIKENQQLKADISGGSFYKESDIDAMQNEIDRLRLLVSNAFFEGISLATNSDLNDKTWLELWESTFSHSVLKLPKDR